MVKSSIWLQEISQRLRELCLKLWEVSRSTQKSVEKVWEIIQFNFERPPVWLSEIFNWIREFLGFLEFSDSKRFPFWLREVSKRIRDCPLPFRKAFRSISTRLLKRNCAKGSENSSVQLQEISFSIQFFSSALKGFDFYRPTYSAWFWEFSTSILFSVRLRKAFSFTSGNICKALRTLQKNLKTLQFLKRIMKVSEIHQFNFERLSV